MTETERNLTVEIGRLHRQVAKLEAEIADLKAGKKPVKPIVREAGRGRLARFEAGLPPALQASTDRLAEVGDAMIPDDIRAQLGPAC